MGVKLCFRLGHAKSPIPVLFPAPAALQRRVFPFLIWLNHLFFSFNPFTTTTCKLRYFWFSILRGSDTATIRLLPLINLVSTVLLSKTFVGRLIVPLKSHQVLQYNSQEVAVHVVANSNTISWVTISATKPQHGPSFPACAQNGYRLPTRQDTNLSLRDDHCGCGFSSTDYM